MTFLARLPVSENDAARLTAAIGEDEELGHLPVDAAELGPSAWEVTIYFEEEPGLALRKRLKKLVEGLIDAPAPLEFAPVPHTNWVAKSLEGLKPVRAGRFLVHGAHDRDKRLGNLVNLEIEAGLAFGTGHHGTTAGCLAAMDWLGRSERPRSVLDLGTGTGVLAIAAAKAWHASVLATDIDRVAMRVAEENARLNGVWGLVETVTAKGFHHPAFERRAPFDWILANILAGPLTAMAEPLAAHLRHGGTAILSGILPGQDRGVVAAYRNAGLRLRRNNVRNGWVTLVLTRD